MIREISWIIQCLEQPASWIVWALQFSAAEIGTPNSIWIVTKMGTNYGDSKRLVNGKEAGIGGLLSS